MKRLLSFLLTTAILLSVMAIAPVVSAVSNNETEIMLSDTAKASDFSWDNASVYFLLTDRFYNGNTSNDHSYNRLLKEDGSVFAGMKTDAAVFQGGDFAGVTKKIEEGYFNKLGVNALWISAPYEQILGYCCGGNGKSSFPHYSYHGYYAGDYSNFDQNYGTEQEFQTMVDSAHKNGIRIVLDIVMNHPGYNTMYDMNEFGYGMLKEGWKNEYYSFAGDNNTYHNYIVYTDSTIKDELDKSWGNWWGGSWIRAELSGYGGFGSGDKLGSAGGELPDFKTESTDAVELPVFMQNKWKSEGTYDQKTAEMNSWFTANSKDKTVRNYLVYWLSRYVEKYGVDGFRCDTAKHVELESWAALKDECSKALRNWRKNNPTKAGADWDEDFWMTGEVYGKMLSGEKDEYFAEGKFDSTINFSFGGGVPTANLNLKYNEYANNINRSEKYNVLTYISSHDTQLAGRSNKGTHDTASLIYQGSAFQLLPGAIQIYYGDETGREYVTHSISSIMTNVRSGNHDVRSFMNWDTIDNEVLEHWQKVGTFRNKHISVGAGQHTSLESTSGVAFDRVYNKNGISDKVLCCVGAEPNTSVTITVNTANIPNGTLLKNNYDGTTAVVTSGKVKFNSGKNGTIICEDAGVAPAVKVSKITLSPTKKTLNVNKTVTLKATVAPSNADNKAVTWKSSNKNVATVTSAGKVKAVKKGTATITCTAKDGSGVKATCVITVKQPVTKVVIKVGKKTVSGKTYKIKKGRAVTLKATCSPSNANNKAVTWKTSKKSIATVTSAGKLKAKKVGRTTITATAKDGSKKSAKVTVSVTKK